MLETFKLLFFKKFSLFYRIHRNLQHFYILSQISKFLTKQQNVRCIILNVNVTTCDKDVNKTMPHEYFAHHPSGVVIKPVKPNDKFYFVSVDSIQSCENWRFPNVLVSNFLDVQISKRLFFLIFQEIF